MAYYSWYQCHLYRDIVHRHRVCRTARILGAIIVLESANISCCRNGPRSTERELNAEHEKYENTCVHFSPISKWPAVASGLISCNG